MNMTLPNNSEPPFFICIVFFPFLPGVCLGWAGYNGGFSPPESGIRSWGPRTWPSSPAPVPRRAVLPPASAWWTTRWTSPMCPTSLGDVLVAVWLVEILEKSKWWRRCWSQGFFKNWMYVSEQKSGWISLCWDNLMILRSLNKNGRTS